MAKSDFIGVRAEPDLRRSLERVAQQRGLTRGGRPNVSWALRQAVRLGLERLHNEEEHDGEES